jgi:uncharacterized Zn-finger protein
MRLDYFYTMKHTKTTNQIFCTDCNKVFFDRAKLSRHERVHTKEKPFRCTYCEKCFTLDFNLRTHIRVHSGEKPFVCKFKGCNKRFSQSGNMKVHEKTHSKHPIRPKLINSKSFLESETRSCFNGTTEENSEDSLSKYFITDGETERNSEIGAYKKFSDSDQTYNDFLIFPNLEF